jgi:hypothetical protein
MKMPIQEITTFKTDDGQVFENLQAAQDHDEELIVSEEIQKLLLRASAYGAIAVEDATIVAAKWMMDYRKFIRDE